MVVCMDVKLGVHVYLIVSMTTMYKIEWRQVKECYELRKGGHVGMAKKEKDTR